MTPSAAFFPPFFFLLFSMLALTPIHRFNAAALSQDQDQDNDATWLLSFKASVYSDPSNLLGSWNTSPNPCSNSSSSSSWFGVSCDPISSRVVSLNLTIPSQGRQPNGFNILSGTLSSSLAHLTHLRILSLAHHAFSGRIPPQLGSLNSLQILELQGCNLSGSIPHSLFLSLSLHFLNLSHNSLSDSIPPGFLNSTGALAVLDLSNNLLSGALSSSKSSSNGCPQSLAYLSLSNNFLVGNIPANIGTCSNLTTLLLNGNLFEGKIPSTLGRLSRLQVLDISRNSLTGTIPIELANCKSLSVLVLTNLLLESDSPPPSGLDFATSRGEFNAFNGGLPSQVLLLPNLQMLWAPRANLAGPLPTKWTPSCSLRVLNLALNNIIGSMPYSLATMCTNLTFLDLSSNALQGYLPPNLQIPCMAYFNVSRNSLSGFILIQDTFDTNSNSSGCGGLAVKSSCGVDLLGLLDLEAEEDLLHAAYSFITPCWASHSQDIDLSGAALLVSDVPVVVTHDFSWNNFSGPLPFFSILLAAPVKVSYWLFLNNNVFNATLSSKSLPSCENLQSFYLNLNSNQVYGEIDTKFFNCSCLVYFEAAQNLINGSIPAEVGNLKKLQHLDLSRNKLSGYLPERLGELEGLQHVLLAENNLTGEIPNQIGELTSLLVLNLSHNDLRGYIPTNLGNAKNLEIVLLDHNSISGEVPSSLAALSNLALLDLSFNNLSGPIPPFKHAINCDSFKGNPFLHSCPDHGVSAPPTGLPFPLKVRKGQNRSKLRSFVIGISTSVSVLVSILTVIFVFILGRRKLSRLASLRRKVVVTFTGAPPGLNYDNVIRATGNFSVGNLIGSGGFGSTYKAELVPGFLVAVKRLSIGRFQGIQQFDAEIRTLGRIRHKNLVTLMGYYVGKAEMFLVYNYLPGGNLDTFIHEETCMNKEWRVIHKIAVDVANALTYLHYSCVPRIVHRDIKPSNILLDEELNAYLSDFGLARLLEVFQTHATTDVAGTFGYVAPEYATTCRVSDKADVYSFGVVLLELLSGKKSLDPSFSEYGNGFNIVAWARLLVAEGRSFELFSPELWQSGPHDDLLAMLRLASSCTVESVSVRPSTKQVLDKLNQLNA
ncbi:LRR receptor-like serine/threonine-protein kinase RPK2 [Coffea arabica]|uniref:non-specific serine/threonine protein kinase n=1 Tax=Coffea arabica TaxID=13443 RepID=A0A6P6UA95_COFAR|nr:LRR receptor-like serine/threonine-protein kinase RPK2 [Coffea arabica]XP_027087374.1 LRR receptor-like serine/threonine-protein kinase RPK2 [Coffea arabica]